MTTLPLMLRVLRDPSSLAGLDAAAWDLLLRQAVACRLQASLLLLVEDAGLLATIPHAAREHLEWTRAVSERHGLAVRWEVRQLAQSLARAGQPALLLKGAAYAIAGLPAGRGRLFTDVDLLVPKESLGPVEASLMMDGWFSTHHDEYDQRYYRTWMHEIPPMQHSKRGSVVDVHHAILPETAPVHPDPARLRAAAIDVPGHPGVKVLGPLDMVLHSATHLFFDGEFDHGLRDLVDIDRLLRHFAAGDSGFWPALSARAAELQLERPLFYALRYARILLETPVPDAALPARRPNTALLALMDALFLRALMPMHPSCDGPLTGTARWCLYVRGNWLRMPPLLLARHLFHKAFISPRQAEQA